MRVPVGASSDVQQAFREAWSAIDRLAAPGNMDLHGNCVVNAGRAVSPFDYTTLADVRDLIAAIQFPESASVDGATWVYYGTHAQRLLKAPVNIVEGALFYETDRCALYQRQVITGVPKWRHVLSLPVRTSDGLYADLTVDDTNFKMVSTVTGYTWVWGGAAWNLAEGTIVDTWANRPLASAVAVGVRFVATDRGSQVWMKTGSAWVLQKGAGGPMTGTLVPDTKPTGLTTNDVGFAFFSTDYARQYLWTGSAWSESEFNDARYVIGLFTETTGAKPGWFYCNGSTVTRSFVDGTVGNYTVPDLVSAGLFLRTAATFGGTGGADTHTHAVNPDPVVSSGPSGTVEVATGAGATVATSDHTHTTDVPSTTSGSGSSLPAYMEFAPYIRL